ncbi:hypothetical protein DKX38_011155 [Salix brachista]|uniref:Uncharacterized protein n=1 Tax=Salix brachista TaxID=2182728 RepID=A0A5N5LYC6_9ROSI|nr:hypothetical protein DKX38_011155 [Salix brachista]
MSSNSVPQKIGEIQENGFSRMQQQMEFMFGELMNRIEKLETRSDGGRSKRGREARKEESVAGNSADEAEDDLSRSGGMESIHQYIESMKTAYLVDQRRGGDGNDPFLEADRRERARKEAAAKRVHPTLHLPANSPPSTQRAGLFASSATSSASTAPQTSTAPALASSGNALSLFNTPSVPSSSMSSSLFATPTTSAPVSSLFGSTVTPLFSSATQAFGTSSSAPALGSASTPSLFGSTPSAFGTNSAGGSLFSTPLTGTVAGSGASFGPTSGVANHLLIES